MKVGFRRCLFYDKTGLEGVSFMFDVNVEETNGELLRKWILGIHRLKMPMPMAL